MLHKAKRFKLTHVSLLVVGLEINKQTFCHILIQISLHVDSARRENFCPVPYMNGCAFICPVLSLPTPTCTPDVHVLNCLKTDSQLSFTMNAISFTVPRKVATGGEGRQAPGPDEMSLVHLFFFCLQTGEDRRRWPA